MYLLTPRRRLEASRGLAEIAARNPVLVPGGPDTPAAAISRGALTAFGAKVSRTPTGVLVVSLGRSEVLVGERIALSTLPLLVGLVTGSLVRSVRWTVPGTAVKNWEATMSPIERAHGTVTPLTSPDMSKRDIAFYWVDGGEGRQVSAECVVYSAALLKSFPLVIQWTFDVRRPWAKLCRSADPTLRGKSRIGNSRATTRKQEFLEYTGAPRLSRPTRIGSVPRLAGIAWDWEVRMPRTKAGGNIKDFQTLWGYVTMTEPKVGGGARRWVWRRRGKDLRSRPGFDPPKGSLVADVVPQPDEPRYGPEFPWPLTPGATESGGAAGADAPDRLLSPRWSSLSVNYLFEYWLLFKPRTPDAIWVPLVKAQWRWKATAIRVKGRWRVIDGGSGAVSPCGSTTVDFPVFEGWAEDRTDATGFDFFEESPG